MGRTVARILGSVNRGEVERKSARQIAAFQQMAEMGKGWGPRQFGYDGNHDHPALIPREADALRQAYLDVMRGDSLLSICKRWDKAGLPTTLGKPWNSVTLKRLLLNPRNIGKRAYRGEIVGDGDWPAIIDVDTWKAVKLHLTAPGRHRGQSTVRIRLLGSLMRCGSCGQKLISGMNNKRPVYKCKNPLCYKVSRRIDEIDEYVVTLILAHLANVGNWVAENEADREEAKQLHGEAAVIRARIDALGIDYAEGNLTGPQMRVASERLEAKLNDVEDRMQRIARSHLFEGLAGVTDLKKVWDGLSLSRRRNIIHALCRNITIESVGKGGMQGRDEGFGVRINWREADQIPDVPQLSR
ncbi:hypothetical protein CG716_11080 [Mycolicibacterium sphagni]|uniref:Recombinase domain-containing protein n=2 Tax=Mycolicibacterium sphagni TaxID=1786 RepID=A0A255DL93_9MYCO|nr:hypothetical protein CG716_11080 [Mycolicibacterium sphagni]